MASRLFYRGPALPVLHADYAKQHRVDSAAPLSSASTVEIDAPVEVVWDALARVDAWPRWAPRVEVLRLTEVRPDEPFVWKLNGIKIDARFAVVQPPGGAVVDRELFRLSRRRPQRPRADRAGSHRRELRGIARRAFAAPSLHGDSAPDESRALAAFAQDVQREIEMSALDVFARIQESFRNNTPGAIADLLTEDSVVEWPFTPPGAPTRLVGAVAFREYQQHSPVASLLRFDGLIAKSIYETKDPNVMSSRRPRAARCLPPASVLSSQPSA